MATNTEKQHWAKNRALLDPRDENSCSERKIIKCYFKGSARKI